LKKAKGLPSNGKSFHTSKWISFAIFTFAIIKEIASGWLKEETWFTRQNGIVQ
jgi:hypothetical protein